MDSDHQPQYIADGDFVNAENMTSAQEVGGPSRVALRSDRAVAHTYPAGVNTVVGAQEDKQSQTAVLFIHNSLGNHQIIRVFDVSDAVEVLAQGPWLAFNPKRRIHDVVIVDGELLYWTDGFADSTDFQGGELRKINMTKASLQKPLSWEVYAGLPGAGQFATGRTYLFRVTDQNGTTLATASDISDGAYLDDPEAGLNWLSGLFIDDLAPYILLEKCDCKLTLTATDKNYFLEFETTDPQVILVPLNHYAAPVTDIQYFQSVLAKYPPECAPVPTYISVSTVEYNNVGELCAQFRTRYVYDDDELSAWSAISVLPLNANQPSLNAIRVDFTDDRLSDPAWLSIIRAVEIAFRDGNDGVFRLVKRIPVCEIGVGTQYYDFLNDGIYTVLPSDDTSTGESIDTQVLQNDQLVPRGATGMCPAADEQGNTKLIVGGLLEGYDCPDCIDMQVIPGTYEDDELVDIVGTVQIQNSALYPSDDPDFPVYALGGFVVYLAGTTYYGVSNNPADGSGDGSFVIRNVPKGKYSIRVASYLASYTDANGPQFNLSNGLEWQKTSAPTIDVAGSLAFNTVRSERLLDLTSFVGPTFDLDTETAFGPIIIQNAHAQHGIMYETYLYDNDGQWNDLVERVSAISVENQVVQFLQYRLDTHAYTGTTVSLSSDHNGHSFFVWPSIPAFPALWVARCVSWDPSPTTAVEPTAQLYLAGNSGWLAITTDVAANTHDEPSPADPTAWNRLAFLGAPGAANISYLFNGDPAWTATKRATVSGNAVDINGLPVANALVWLFQGRFTRTNQVGQFFFAAFAYQNGTTLSGTQNTYCTYEPDTAADYPVPPYNTASFPITNLALPDPTFQFGFKGGIVPGGRFLKSGGVYGVGIVYEDDFGRTCGVAAAPVFNAPFHTEDGQYIARTATFSISNVPPVWAKRYRIVRTKDSYYQEFVHMPVTSARYVVISNGYAEPQDTSYLSGTATHILLQIQVDQVAVPSTTQLLVMFREDNPDGYRAKLGDRVRYLLDEEQQPVFDGNILDQNVVGEYIDGDDYYVVIPFDQINREIVKGWIFEFYTPASGAKELYYETGVCLPILEPGTGNRRHKGITTDQSFLPAIPATGPLLSGDTYWYNRQYVLSDGDGIQFFAENDRMRLTDEAPCEDIGRPFVVDPNAKEQFQFDKIVVSGTYIPNSSINGLSQFGSLDYIRINRIFGPIKTLLYVNQAVLALCEFKAQPIYVGKGRLMDLSGETVVGRSASILNIANEIVPDAGTVNPESACVENSRIYWWDLRNGVVWRFGPDGVQNVNGTMSAFFQGESDKRKPILRIEDYVVSGFDGELNQMYLTFMDATAKGDPVAGRSIVMNAENGRWSFFYTPKPSAYVPVARSLYTAYPAIYKMYSGAGFLNLGGAQRQGSVRFATNGQAAMMKDWHNVRVRSTKRVFCPEVIVGPESIEYPSGMKSSIPIQQWQAFEGQQFAWFLRDATDPHVQFTIITDPVIRAATATIKGRYLKGETAIIEIRILVPSQGGIITFADVEWSVSNITR